MKRLGKFLRENGLSLAFWLLFVAAIVGLGLLAEKRLPPSGHLLTSPDFIEAISSNWQAAFLQLLALIVFSEFLRQRGAPHSKRGKNPKRQQSRTKALYSWVYSNSLSLAFAALFIAAFVAFFLSDFAKHSRAAVQPVSAGDFFLSGGFWFDVLQTWQAEFLAMACLLVLSVFLRQEKSAESKPTSASNADTGEANE